MPRGETGPARFGLPDTPAVRADLVASGLWSPDDGPKSDAVDTLAVLARVGDPTLALRHLAELMTALAIDPPGHAACAESLRTDPGFRMRLLALVGASRTLGEHLAGHPDHWRRLLDSADVLPGGSGDGGPDSAAEPDSAASAGGAAQPAESAGVAGTDGSATAATTGSAPGRVPVGDAPAPATTTDASGHAALVDEPREPWWSTPVRDAAARALRAVTLGPDGRTLPVADAIAPLRVEYRARLAAIAAADLAGNLGAVGPTVPEVGRALSDLADALLEAALDVARAAHPAPQPFRLSVIAMGKCGARELNYVSDVDVMFVVGSQAAADSAGDVDVDAVTLRLATAQASDAMRICGRVAWEVDAGLRPEGKAGPLVRTLAGYRSYYAKWAKTWEFQALLKARVAAGDPDLGAAFVGAVTPLVWAAANRSDFVADVQQMRRRVRESVPLGDRDSEIKLGAGGLRDVEFAVQLLQLVHGRADTELRAPGTLDALGELTDRGYVGREDGAELAAAYAFERRIEHLAQLQHLQRTHSVPVHGPARLWLARSAGFAEGGTGDAVTRLDAELVRHGATIRRLHEKLFYRPLLAAVAAVPTAELRLTPEAAGARLAALGFAAPQTALKHLAALTDGLSRRAAIQRTLLPVLLGTFADSPDPDKGLLGYRAVSDALADTPWYLRLLRDEGMVAVRLARLLGISRLVADLLERAPEVLRLLAADGALMAPDPQSAAAAAAEALAARAERGRTAEVAAAAARSARRHDMLRIACADLLGQASPRTVAASLTSIADATVLAALAAAHRAVFADRLAARTEAAAARAIDPQGSGDTPADPAPSGEGALSLAATVSVIAMGRFGGAEMGYSSDADVLFVAAPTSCEADPAAVAADAAAIAKATVELLGRPSPDPALTIDADLRPEGRGGPLVRTVDSYAEYWSRHIQPWERQALLRARPLDPTDPASIAFLAVIDPLRYPAGGLPAADVREIRRIKARVDTERLPRRADRTLHTKLGSGGLSDIEWTAQLVQLRHAAAHPELRVTSTLAAIDAAADAGLIDAESARILARGWETAGRARNAIMLVTGRANDEIPPHGPILAGIARVCGYPADVDPGAFVDDYRSATRHARRVVDQLFDQA